MKNTSGGVAKKRRAAILTNFTKKMKRSGYSAKVRRNVLLAGLKGYWNMVKTEKEGGRRVNRPRWEGASSRRYKKLGARSNWFKKKGKNPGGIAGGRVGGKQNSRKDKKDDREIETIMFIPHTPGGELAKLIQEADDEFSRGRGIGRVKIIERGGTIP